MKANILLLFFTILCVWANAQQFSLHGELKGFEDGTKIIINPFLENMDIDMDNETTLELKDGKFRFEKKLKNPTKYSLRVRPVDDGTTSMFEHLFFWAENTSMELIGEKGQVFNAVVSGSDIQDDYSNYINNIAPIVKAQKQIGDSIRLTEHLSEAQKTELRNQRFKHLEEWEKRTFEFIYNNPNYYCSAAELIFYITFNPSKIDRDKLAEFYRKLETQIRNNVYGKQIETFLQNQSSEFSNSEIKVGDMAFDFTLTNIEEEPVTFSEIKSKIILLDFWASGCGPCRKEHNIYSLLYEKFHHKGLEIVSVSQDQSRKRWMSANKKDCIEWISLWDAKKKVSKLLYKVNYLPSNFIIDNKGVVIGKNIRGEKLQEELGKLLRK